MDSVIQQICTVLDLIANTILAQPIGDNTYLETYGWNCVALTRHDLAGIASQLSNDIKQADYSSLSDGYSAKFASFPRQLQVLLSNTIPHLANGNSSAAGVAYMGTIASMRMALLPIISPKIPDAPSWEVLLETKALPSQLAKKLRSIQAELELIIPNKEQIESQLKSIQDAHATAETLSIDIKDLADKRKVVEKLSSESQLSHTKIEDKFKEATRLADEISTKNDEAEKLVANCEAAYQITTTKGLAAAFDERASNLSRSMWIWVIGLLISLGLGAWAGSHRISQLSTLLSASDPKIGIIWLQITLSLLSVGAPIWFSWLATKQIGQRFRLAEDYAFKASVAKAYEGYRKEAAKIDKAFEARLFSSALTRLEEAPLRLVEHVTHGSPWHELLSSKLNKNKSNEDKITTAPTTEESKPTEEVKA